MKVSKLWLQELTKQEIDTNRLADELSMAGLEVDSVQPSAPSFHGVVVGEVLTTEPHPNADKLTVCKVKVGESSDALNIVCGASNVRPNLKVAVALVGAELPEGFKIKKAKLRGVESEGMLCSAEELKLPEKSSGIMELPSDASVGMDFRKYYDLDDDILEIELTANRGDCLSMIGVAREYLTINGKTFVSPKVASPEAGSDKLSVKVLAFNGCPHYCGRIIRGINNRTPTPIWIQTRLRSLGINPISLIVDITNYVMLELGQPLHAFDLAKINDHIEVRFAESKETIKLLDGQVINLDKRDLVIADQKQILALAGIMGGINSGIDLETQDIFIESAFFSPKTIAQTAQANSLQTDSSYRFERGIDPDIQLNALNRVTEMLLKIAQGKAGAVTEIKDQNHSPKPATISLAYESVKNVLGVLVPESEITDILLHLGFSIKPTNNGLLATVPSWRIFDLKIEEDLIEEIGRIYGYHKIPEQKICSQLCNSSEVVSNKLALDRISALMEDLGYHEVITYSFIDEKTQKLLGGKDQAIGLANPISSEQSVMRTTLWPGLIKVIKANSKRQNEQARFYETGLRFIPEAQSELRQTFAIAGAIYGNLYPKQWGIKQKEPADFFDLKNDVTKLLRLFVNEVEIEFVSEEHNGLHPKRSARIYVQKKPLGFIGQLHPLVKQQLEIDNNLVLFEINLDFINKELHNNLKQYSVFPKIKRDIAIIVDKNIPWIKIRQKIVDISGDLLQNVDLFDVYYNENIGLGKLSMAIRLTFQSTARTLVEAEVEVLMERIILELKQSFGATLRG